MMPFDMKKVMTLLPFLACLALAEDRFRPGTLVENVTCLSDPTQSYTLYLPSNYAPPKSSPLLLIFDPRGRGTFAAEIFREPAERFGWIILSSNNTRSDTSWEPNARALQAIWPEANRRYSTDRARIYAAGFSGGAMVAWHLARGTGGLAGIISVGGRIASERDIEDVQFAHFGAAGRYDFNYREMLAMDRVCAERGVPHRLVIFDGAHQWMPQPIAAQAVEWMEIQAIRKTLRAHDEALVRNAYQRDLSFAKELEAAGLLLETRRHYQSTATTFGGLLAAREAQDAVTRLNRHPRIKDEEKAERQAGAFEELRLHDLAPVVARLRDLETPLTPAQVTNDLRLRQLQKQARQQSREGYAAQRVVEAMFTQLSFYLPQEFTEKGRFNRAALVLTVATEIKPELAWVWYNLACAEARAGMKKKALHSLQTAIEKGFTDYRHIRNDPDLASLRDEPRFQDLLARQN